ncbi:MAG TPA: ABC transporter substrate-binding protein [Trueperaceae bacterium]|nr:ABC transporter substrate-binding protein [Trueperaceae bacterium]HRP47262.1 ABC transporter substrate-binding protein [Trueperaceae bacterium]
MTKRITRLLLAVATAMVALGFANAQDTHGVSPLEPAQSVKVAYVPILKFATLYVAQDRGLFERYGLNVQLESVASGTEAIAFLEQGQIDVGGIAIVTSLWNGWNQGIDVRVFAPGGLEPFVDSPTKVLVRKDLYDSGAVTSAADLAGRTVAFAGGPGSGGEYLTAKALEPAGLTIRDVEIISLGNADIPAAFENGSIDAALLGSPYADQVEAAGTAVAVATDLVPGLMTVAFVGSGKFLNERPEVAKRFALALLDAARLMQGDDYLAPENIAAYLHYVNSTEEAVRTGTPVLYDPNLAIPVDGLADVERVHRENGRTEYDTPIDLTKVITTEFADWALEAAGPYQQ